LQPIFKILSQTDSTVKIHIHSKVITKDHTSP